MTVMVKKHHFEIPRTGAEFEAVRRALPGADKGWLDDMRAKAMAKFLADGIPGPRVEEWKYTNLGFLANENFTVAGVTGSQTEAETLFAAAYIGEIAGPVVVFVNGHLNSELSSLPHQNEVSFTGFSDNPEAFRDTLSPSDSPLDNLNRALVTDGYALQITGRLTQPVQIIHLATSDAGGTALRTRCKIRAGRNCKAQIIEIFLGAENTRYWSHMAGDVVLDAHADLSICQFQLQGKRSIHMTELHTKLAEKSCFCHVSLQMGAELSRTELINSFRGEFAEINLRGAFLGQNKAVKMGQSHDIFTRINHDKPHCESHQFYRGVLDAGGKGAFQGKVVVARNAQKTNANQSCKNLLLSRRAEANVKPELLIYADDVKCSHGATVGELNPDQLFYLRARGMDERTATGLLVQAFVAEVFEGLDNEILQDKFKEKAADWLSKEEVS